MDNRPKLIAPQPEVALAMFTHRRDRLSEEQKIAVFEYQLLHWIVGPASDQRFNLNEVKPWIKHESR